MEGNFSTEIRKFFIRKHEYHIDYKFSSSISFCYLSFFSYATFHNLYFY